LNWLLNDRCFPGGIAGSALPAHGNVRAHLHVEHDGFPLRRRPLGWITLGMAAVAIHRVKLRPGEMRFNFPASGIEKKKIAPPSTTQSGLPRPDHLAIHGWLICAEKIRVRDGVFTPWTE
jgi:hypothetical protein